MEQKAITKEQKKLLKDFYEENKDLIQLVYEALSQSPEDYGDIVTEDADQIKEIASVLKRQNSTYKYSFTKEDGEKVERTEPAYARATAQSKTKLTKANLVWDIISTYVKEINPSTNLETLKSFFEKCGTYETVLDARDTDATKMRSRFNETIELSDGRSVKVSNQWGKFGTSDSADTFKKFKKLMDEKGIFQIKENKP